MIRDLAKKLAAFEEFKGFVIIEITFRHGSFDSAAQILKSNLNMALLQANSAHTQVLVKMIRPRTEIKAALDSQIQSAEKIWRIFTTAEIFDFAEVVGDKNPIHQTKPPIVPAFLILESICAEFNADFIKLKFKNFITAGEPLTLQRSDNKFEIICAGVEKVTGELS